MNKDNKIENFLKVDVAKKTKFYFTFSNKNFKTVDFFTKFLTVTRKKLKFSKHVKYGISKPNFLNIFYKM